MKNKIKILILMSALIMSMFSIAGCSGNNTGTDSSVPSDNESSVSSLPESTAEESSKPETSTEISYETTSTAESSTYTDSSAIDPAVEERSYSKEEQTKFQDTKIPFYKYYPYEKSYYYQGNESIVTIPSDFSTCPIILSDTVKEIIVPETVKNIPENAFTGCPNLEKLVVLNPDCKFERTAEKENSGVGFLSEIKQILPSLNVDVYMYCHSDKTPADKLNNRLIPKSLTSTTAKFFSANYSELLIHDLATESYE